MTASRLYRIGSVLLALFALGHTLGFRQTDPSWGVDSLLASMQATRFRLQGFDRTYWEFFTGFGFQITVFLLFLALLSWQIGGLVPALGAPLRKVRWGLAACSAAIACLSWVYFFPAPGVLSTAAAVCLTAAALIRTGRNEAGVTSRDTCPGK